MYAKTVAVIARTERVAWLVFFFYCKNRIAAYSGRVFLAATWAGRTRNIRERLIFERYTARDIVSVDF